MSNFDKLEENQASYWGLRGVGWGEGRDRQAGPKMVLGGGERQPAESEEQKESPVGAGLGVQTALL